MFPLLQPLSQLTFKWIGSEKYAKKALDIFRGKSFFEPLSDRQVTSNKGVPSLLLEHR